MKKQLYFLVSKCGNKWFNMKVFNILHKVKKQNIQGKNFI